MKLKALILILSLGAISLANAAPELGGSWVRTTSPDGSSRDRALRTIPVAVDIKQGAAKIEITATQHDGVKSLYDCPLASPCAVTVSGKTSSSTDWWVRWDGAELVLEMRRDPRSPASELWRLHLSADSQTLLLRSSPQPTEYPFRKK
jgi:hypothetical protein